MPRLGRLQRLVRLRPPGRSGALPFVLAANQSVLDTLHQTVALPWWATIVGTTCALRSAFTLPIAVYQQRSVGKMIQLAPLVQSWAETLKVHVASEAKEAGWDYKKYQQELQKQYRAKVNRLYSDHGCARWKLLMLPWVQMPLFISMSLTLRHLSGYPLPWYGQLADAPAPGLTEGGLAWFTDLTVPDSTLIFPFLIGAGNLINVELNAYYARQGEQTRTQKILTNVFRCLSVAFIPIAAHAPMAIGLYWFTSSWYSVAQNVAFRIPTVRHRLGMPALPKPKPKYPEKLE